MKILYLFSMLLPLAGTAWAALPAGWSDADIGSPGLAGSASYASGLWTGAGGGSDIWGTADQFNFASTNYTGDGMMIARVTSLQNSDPSSGWSKAGLMFRNDTTAGSVNVTIVATWSQGVSFQWRSTAGGSSSFSAIGGITAPVWLKLVRSGANFTGYYSTDGAAWVPVSSQQITMNNTVMAGLDVTAHNNSALNTATFTNFSLAAPPPANVTLNAGNVISTVPTDAFGIFMAVWDGWGTGTAASIEQAGVTAMRYPGGSYADIYHWSSYLSSPVDGESGDYGYLSGSTTMPDFINLCSNAQSQAVISVDWGSGFLWNAGNTEMTIPGTNGTPQEAAAWVAYCNASTNIYGATNDVTIGVDALGNNWQTAGYWAHLRASAPLRTDDGSNFLRMNRSAPVGIKYWEIGNEPYGNGYYGGEGWENDYAVPYPYTTYPRYTNALLSPTAYGQAVKAFSIAMKAVDPTVKVGAYSSTPPGDYSWDYISGVNNGEHWTPQVLAQCGSNIDFVIVHWYPSYSDDLGIDLLSEVGSTIPVMINGTGPYPHTGTNSGLEDWITNYCPNPGNVQIFVTEFGAGSSLTNNIGTMPILGPVEALFWADCMSTWMNYPAFVNADWLDYDGDSFLGSGSNGPVVCAMQMLRHLCNPGDAFVNAASDTSTLRAQGVARQDGQFGILLINESEGSSQTVNVTVANARLNANGVLYQFGTNNWSGPSQYSNEVPSSGPTSNSISALGNSFTVTLPAYTMDVLVIPIFTPPALAAISSQTVNVGQTVAFTANATDTNQPAPPLTFALMAGATNATLNSSSGAFSFRPLVTQANSTINFTLKVSDNGTPPLSAMQSFSIKVNPLSQPSLSSISLNNSQITMQINGQSGPDYEIQTSTNLTQWSAAFTTNSPAMPFSWQAAAPANSARFYRVVVGPPLP